jgi:hypothetical protein
VPEIAVEGDPLVAVGDALVLENVDDVEQLRAAHEAGRPVVVRADSPDAVVAALRRPEVASVLVPAERPELLQLDLRELTYG